jgi:dTDP-4-dehydrorhamnose reductase
MRYLVTGARGMLGSDLAAVLAETEGADVTLLSRADLDVTDPAATLAAAVGHDVIVNTAAYTAVDDAEQNEDDAAAINALGAENLAIAAREAGAKLVQVSTDYVFGGDATTPYSEDEPRRPLGAYGRTKAEGERLALAAHPQGVYVVRTAWLYGRHGGNFADTMLKLAASRPGVTVVDDQLGQPTWTLDLARQIVALVESGAPAGVYHGTNGGETSWFGFARAVYSAFGLDPERVQPTDSASFVRPAPRPSYSVLGHDRWSDVGLAPMRPWQDALSAAVADGALRYSGA